MSHGMQMGASGYGLTHGYSSYEEKDMNNSHEMKGCSHGSASYHGFFKKNQGKDAQARGAKPPWAPWAGSSSQPGGEAKPPSPSVLQSGVAVSGEKPRLGGAAIAGKEAPGVVRQNTEKMVNKSRNDMERAAQDRFAADRAADESRAMARVKAARAPAAPAVKATPSTAAPKTAAPKDTSDLLFKYGQT